VPENDSLPTQLQSEQTPPNFKLILGGAVLALLTLFAAIIGFASVKQAPPHPPVVEGK